MAEKTESVSINIKGISLTDLSFVCLCLSSTALGIRICFYFTSDILQCRQLDLFVCQSPIHPSNKSGINPNLHQAGWLVGSDWLATSSCSKTHSFLSLCPQYFHHWYRCTINKSTKLTGWWLLKFGILFPWETLYVTKIWRIHLQLEYPEIHLVKFTAADQFLITYTYVRAPIIIFKYLWDWSLQNSPLISISLNNYSASFIECLFLSFICSFTQKDIPECLSCEWCSATDERLGLFQSNLQKNWKDK